MALATVGTTTTAEATGTAGVTNNVPTGVVDGNLLVWRWSGAGSATVAATPTGWTLLQSGTTTVNAMAVWYRIASSEPASYTLGTLGASMRTTGTMSAYSGVDTVTPWDVATPAFVAGTTATTSPAITPVTAGAWVFGFGDANVASGVTNTTFSSSNLTAIDGQVSSTQGAATNNVGAIGHFVWSSGAFTPAWTTSNASVRTLGGSAALRPAAAAASPTLPARPARRGVRPTFARRGRATVVVPTQVVVVPSSTVPDARRRPVRILVQRRRRPAEPVPPQVDPNAYAGVYTDVIPTRRRRPIEVTPPQTVAPTAPSYVSETRRRARALVARRRGRAEVPPPQIATPPPAYPPAARRRTVRGIVTRRRNRVEVVPPQIVVPPPAYVPEPRRRLARGFVTRRRSRIEVTPPQVAVTPPAYVPEARRRRIRGLATRRRRPVEVVPPQATVAPPNYVPATPARHTLRSLPRRTRRTEVVRPQAAPTAPSFIPQLPRRALRTLFRRVGRIVGIPAPGLTPGAPVADPVLVLAPASTVLTLTLEAAGILTSAPTTGALTLTTDTPPTLTVTPTAAAGLTLTGVRPMTTPYTVGDTAPDLTGTFNADGTGATGVAHVARPDGSVFSHAVTFSSPTPTSTSWSMTLVDGDLSLPGVYRVELEVTFSNGKHQTFYYDTAGTYSNFTVRDQIG